MPTCPIANPSQTAIAGKTIGTPPPSATPCFTASTILSRFMWPGTISFFELTTPINGRPISSSQRPKAFKRARCGAALTPSFKGALLTVLSPARYRDAKCTQRRIRRTAPKSKTSVLLGFVGDASLKSTSRQ